MTEELSLHFRKTLDVGVCCVVIGAIRKLSEENNKHRLKLACLKAERKILGHWETENLLSLAHIY